MTEDSALLRRYAETRADDAFAELVRRHIDLVYSVALRQVGGDAHLAQDVAQTVFTALARKARELTGREVISGWLYRSTHYAASDAVRAERRRRTREQEAHAMQEITTASEPTPDLENLRPLLDAAIGELGETDRDAVCLRYFENRSYAEIGARLRLSENSARMRVERALDKLHGMLARRGISSTTAALALALPGQAATTAPLGLAATITQSALIATASAAAGWTILTLMNTPKIALGTAAVISLIAIATSVRISRSAAEEVVAAREARAAASARVAELESQLAVYAKASAAAEADNAKLLATVDTAAAQLKTPPTEEPTTHDKVEARYKHAQELHKAGRLEEALTEYLWCYDVGMRQTASFQSIRLTSVLSDLVKLGERLPAALAAVRQRQELARNQFLGGSGDLEAGQDFAALNYALKEQDRTLQLFDSLAQDDRRRKTLVPFLHAELTAAQRYAEAAKAIPYSQASALFEIFSNQVPTGNDPAHTEQLRFEQRQRVIKQTTTSIEVFLGAGEIEHAADLAIRVLEFDSTPETIALLEKHAARAGHPDLIATLRAK